MIAEVSNRGLRMNNLFMLQTGRWQANVRTDDGLFGEFGQGETPEAALKAALAKAPQVGLEELLG